MNNNQLDHIEKMIVELQIQIQECKLLVGTKRLVRMAQIEERVLSLWNTITLCRLNSFGKNKDE